VVTGLLIPTVAFADTSTQASSSLSLNLPINTESFTDLAKTAVGTPMTTALKYTNADWYNAALSANIDPENFSNTTVNLMIHNKTFNVNVSDVSSSVVSTGQGSITNLIIHGSVTNAKGDTQKLIIGLQYTPNGAQSSASVTVEGESVAGVVDYRRRHQSLGYLTPAEVYFPKGTTQCCLL
jgi:hypothetical protein